MGRITKRLISLTLVFVVVFINIPGLDNILSVKAANLDFTQGNLKFIITNSNNKEVSVQASDKPDFSGSNSSVVIPNTVTYNGDVYSVTSVAEKGFEAYYTHKKCIDITSVSLPDTVTSIGYMAFAYCENLKEIKISKNLKRIDENAFYFCCNLEDLSLNMMKSLPDIGCCSLYKANKEIKIYVRNKADVNNAINKYNNVKPLDSKNKSVGLGIELNASNVLAKEIIEIKNVVISDDDIWTKTKIVSFDVDPKESKVKEVKYEFNGKQVVLNGNENHYNFEINENGLYKLIAQDVLENITEYEIIVSKIDNTAPIITYISGNPVKWQKDDVVVKFKIIDDQSGIESVICEQGLEVKIGENNEYSLDIAENGYYTLVATDKLGNSRKETVIVDKIDKEAPKITYVGGNPTSWQKDNAVIEFKIIDEQSGVNSVICKQGLKIENKGNGEYSLEVSANGEYVIEAEDKAGNVSEYTIIVDKLDTEGPVISDIEGNPTSWQRGNATIEFKVKDSKSGIVDVSCSNGRSKIKLCDLGNGKYSFVISVNGTYVITARDNAGNQTIQEVEVTKIDNTAPLIENISGNPTKWQRVSAYITFNVEDLESGVRSVSYVNPDGRTTEIVGDSGLYEFEANKNGIYKIIAVDNMGNTVEKTIVVDKLDLDKPEIVKIRGNPTKWQFGSAKISFKAFDNTSGIYKITVLKDDEEKIRVTSKGNGMYTFDAKSNGIYKITVTDLAGNTTTKYINVKYIR